MRVLMIVFMPYFGLGIFTGIVIRGMCHLDPKGYAILAGFYVALAAIGWFLATKSQTEEGRAWIGVPIALSRSAWYVGLVLANLAGTLTGIYH